MKLNNFLECSVWLVLLILVVLSTSCAPAEYRTVTNNDCVIYLNEKVKCKHGQCTPIPTATPKSDSNGAGTEPPPTDSSELSEEETGCEVYE